MEKQSASLCMSSHSSLAQSDSQTKYSFVNLPVAAVGCLKLAWREKMMLLVGSLLCENCWLCCAVLCCSRHYLSPQLNIELTLSCLALLQNRDREPRILVLLPLQHLLVKTAGTMIKTVV